MHHHARGLVHDPQAAVLEQGRQVHGLGLQVQGGRGRVGQFGLHRGAGPDAGPGLERHLAVHPHVARAHPGVTIQLNQ